MAHCLIVMYKRMDKALDRSCVPSSGYSVWECPRRNASYFTSHVIAIDCEMLRV